MASQPRSKFGSPTTRRSRWRPSDQSIDFRHWLDERYGPEVVIHGWITAGISVGGSSDPAKDVRSGDSFVRSELSAEGTRTNSRPRTRSFVVRSMRPKLRGLRFPTT